MYFDLPSNPVSKTKPFGSKKAPKRREFWTFEEYSKFSNAIQLSLFITMLLKHCSGLVSEWVNCWLSKEKILTLKI